MQRFSIVIMLNIIVAQVEKAKVKALAIIAGAVLAISVTMLFSLAVFTFAVLERAPGGGSLGLLAFGFFSFIFIIAFLYGVDYAENGLKKGG
jgi:hypothetical protein